MSKLKIKTKERRFETARDLYGIFFEDINRAGDGGLYPEMLRNRSFEDSVLPEGYIQQEDGIHVKTVSGWLDEFCNGEGLCRWVKGNNIPETEIPAWYTHNAKMELELTDTLNEHRDAALRIQFEKDGSLTNTGYCGISVKAGESYSLYLFAKAKETSVYKGYKQDKIEMRGDRAEMSDFPLYLNTVAGGLDRRDQTIGGFSFVVKIYAVPVVEIIG